MDEPEITAEQLIGWASVRIRRDFAEGLARYANLRASGLLPVDARRETDVSQQTGNRYENWMQGYRRDQGLPELSTGTGVSVAPSGQHLRDAIASGHHQRWHAPRGVIDPECEHCR